MCLAQGHNTVTQVKLKPEAPWSRVKLFTTEPPLRVCVHLLLCVTEWEIKFHGLIVWQFLFLPPPIAPNKNIRQL